MARNPLFATLALVAGLCLTLACSLVSPEASFAVTHPQELTGGRPQCTECHTTDVAKGPQKPFASFDHTLAFVKDHKYAATADRQTCAVCHAPTFCNDCHAGQAPMKPALKLSDSPERVVPHRGDYLTLHKIEGRLDPSSCFKCHGRANNDKCRVCHR
jgi:hypothetical protein